MKFIYIFIILYLFSSCDNKNESSSDFNDKVLDLIIEHSNGESIEFPELYDQLADSIPEDTHEQLKLVRKLKEKGFKVTNYGRGNYPPLGPRIVSFTLKKDNCECEVAKIYYLTITRDKYIMTEKINCFTVSKSKN